MFPKYICLGNDKKRYSCLIKVYENENDAYYWRPGGMWGISVNKDLITNHKMEHLNNKQAYPCSIIDFIVCNGGFAMEEQFYQHTITYNSFMKDIKTIEDLFKNK